MAGKAGVVGAVLAVGVLLARVGDTCGVVAMRSAGSLADDGARLSRLGADLTDAERAGRRVGALEDPSRLARGVGSGVDGASGRVGGGLDDAAGPGERLWSRVLVDAGEDVAIELVKTDFDDEVPEVVRTVGAVRCPRVVSLVGDAWEQLLGGLGVACAPIVVVGAVGADGMSLRHGEGDASLAGLAGACARLGARCVFVGCPAVAVDACVEATERSLTGNHVQPSLALCVDGFVARAWRQATPPVFVAQLTEVDGAVRLVVARAQPGIDGPPRASAR